MNYSEKVLKLLGMELAAELLKTEIPAEQRLWRAVISLAFEDVLNNSNSKTEAVLKANAHDWIIGNSKDYENVCYSAGFDPEFVRNRYLEALEKNVVNFTTRQNNWIEYSRSYEKLRNERKSNEREKIKKRINKIRLKLFNNSK
jgi:hypothetical protein